MQTPSFVIRNLLYIIKCCKVFVNSMFVFRQRQRAENPPRRLRIFVKDAHLQNFLSFLKKTLDFPGGGRYNKTRSPARTPREYAPVAQLDRVSDYESEGRGFESLPAHQASAPEQKCFGAFLLVSLFSKRTNGGNHCERRSPPLIRFENQKKACLYSVPGSGCSPAFPRPSIPAGRFLPMRVVLDGGVCCIPAAFEADHSTEVNTSTGTASSIFKVQR